MKKILLFTILTHITFQCSMTSGFVPASLSEQAKNAGIILIGTVKPPPAPKKPKEGLYTLQINLNPTRYSVELHKIKYIRGCNKTQLKIDGFRPGTACGPGNPDLNEKIIIFACGDNNFPDQNLSLNSFTSYTGYTRWTQEKEDLVRGIVGNKGLVCSDFFFSERCLGREFMACPPVPIQSWNRVSEIVVRREFPVEERVLEVFKGPIMRNDESDESIQGNFN